MKKLMLIFILGAAVWYGFGNHDASSILPAPKGVAVVANAFGESTLPTTATAPFSCDVRRYCSQMRSCAEATYFIQHCPNTKMDGDGDGVPCESQWCR